ncbi:LRR receptor-like serine/threonine-protein kinase, partial [Bienertia sinuspersici]
YSLADNQVEALMRWKKNLKSSTNTLVSWNPANPNPCTWFGILCDNDNQVTEISLQSAMLEGPLPSTLKPLHHLTTLVLSSMNLHGEIPEEWGDYQSIKMIDISKQLYHRSKNFELVASQSHRRNPLEIANCSNLVKLGLASTSITGAIPSSIGNLKNIKTIAIYDSNISGQFPKQIGYCSKLQIWRLGNLKILYLWQNRLVGHIPYEQEAVQT